ncbi:MAG TPA: transcriptional regulator, partial [Algoriphagus sp.]|nr:transcriptional regulator [Algoriphagus sp.]
MLIHLNIKFLRKKKALTQESLSEALGISRSKLAG